MKKAVNNIPLKVIGSDGYACMTSDDGIVPEAEVGLINNEQDQHNDFRASQLWEIQQLMPS